MKTVIFYEHATDRTMEEFMAVFPKHQEVEARFLKTGKVLGTGAFANPGEGAMAIFADRETAEKFVAEDPFVIEGLIAKVTIKDWNDEIS